MIISNTLFFFIVLSMQPYLSSGLCRARSAGGSPRMCAHVYGSCSRAWCRSPLPPDRTWRTSSRDRARTGSSRDAERHTSCWKIYSPGVLYHNHTAPRPPHCSGRTVAARSGSTSSTARASTRLRPRSSSRAAARSAGAAPGARRAAQRGAARKPCCSAPAFPRTCKVGRL